jgi:hypothetical protein
MNIIRYWVVCRSYHDLIDSAVWWTSYGTEWYAAPIMISLTVQYDVLHTVLWVRSWLERNMSLTHPHQPSRYKCLWCRRGRSAAEGLGRCHVTLRTCKFPPSYINLFCNSVSFVVGVWEPLEVFSLFRHSVCPSYWRRVLKRSNTSTVCTSSMMKGWSSYDRIWFTHSGPLKKLTHIKPAHLLEIICKFQHVCHLQLMKSFSPFTFFPSVCVCGCVWVCGG